MEKWTQRENWKSDVAAYRKSAKVKLSDIAQDLGITEATLKDYLYRHDTRPSLAVLQRSSALFQTSINRYIDNPGEPVPFDGWDGISDLDRMILLRIKQDLADTPEHQKLDLLRLWSLGVQIQEGK